MIVLLAGPTATGKTSVAAQLAVDLELPTVSARQILQSMTGAQPTRADLQRAGVDLDRRTGGRWILEYLADHHADQGVIVDAMRTRRQTEPALTHMPSSRLLYLDASESTRRERYLMGSRTDRIKGGTTFDQAEAHPTERHVHLLRPLAHAIVETDQLTIDEVVTECLSILRA